MRDARDEPRDATRGGGNGPALPSRRDGIEEESPPPFWGRWGRIYLLVAGLLLAETGAFWALTRWAS